MCHRRVPLEKVETACPDTQRSHRHLARPFRYQQARDTAGQLHTDLDGRAVIDQAKAFSLRCTRSVPTTPSALLSSIPSGYNTNSETWPFNSSARPRASLWPDAERWTGRLPRRGSQRRNAGNHRPTRSRAPLAYRHTWPRGPWRLRSSTPCRHLHGVDPDSELGVSSERDS